MDVSFFLLFILCISNASYDTTQIYPTGVTVHRLFRIHSLESLWLNSSAVDRPRDDSAALFRTHLRDHLCSPDDGRSGLLGRAVCRVRTSAGMDSVLALLSATVAPDNVGADRVLGDLLGTIGSLTDRLLRHHQTTTESPLGEQLQAVNMYLLNQ